MFSSREAGARFLCVRVTQCTARGERQRDYATSTVDSQRSGAKQGKEACMRRSERAVRTPWRQERRQRYAQERRHLSSAMRHRWGRALTKGRSEHPGGLHRPQKGPGGEAHRNPSLFVRSWPWGEAVTRPWRYDSARERCSLLARNLPEVKEKHWFSTSSETIRGCPLGDGKRGSRGCQGRARLPK